MSLKTWKKEFYPIAASKVAKHKALEHSLRKWRGLTPDNLKKHGVESEHDEQEVFAPDGSLSITAETCALCHHFFDRESECAECPLGKKECNNAYGEWMDYGNEQPMIEALETALKRKKGA